MAVEPVDGRTPAVEQPVEAMPGSQGTRYHLDPQPRSPEGAHISVEGLTWRPYGRRVPVLDGLDLSIAAGQRVLLAGPSGSGKSTLLRALAGLLLTADSGELTGSVRVDDRDPQEVPGSVGLVLQDPGAGVVASTIGRDVAFGLENLRTARAEMGAVVAEALAEVGLTMPEDSAPSTLSGGESQRLALAGALALSPRVLLLDEPTAMLDRATAATVRSVVDEVVARRGLTLVVVEHRLDGWLDLVDRLVVLDETGTTVADGIPGEVLSAHAEEIAAQGIWVPGLPEPEPLQISLPPASGGCAAVVPRGHQVVEAAGVTVEHRSRRLGQPSRTTVAVRDAELRVDAGETVALVGPSGAGKSTLMTTLGGLTRPTAGSVEFAPALVSTAPSTHPDRKSTSRHDRAASGESAAVSTEPPHEWPSRDLARVVAWVPQRAATAIVGSTVSHDVLTTPDAVGLDPAVAAARSDALLDALGLAHLADVDPWRLSGGEQRRLALASAVVHAPALVLADEPTVGQDRLTWAAVMGVLELATREGSAVVLTTHDPGAIARADRVVSMTAPTPPATRTGPEVRRKPLLARVGPLALLLVGLSVLPLPALIGSWRQGLTVLAVELVLGLVGLLAPGRGMPPEGRIRGLLTRLAPAALAVVGVGWSAWLLGGRDLEVAFGAALRVLCLIVPSAFVVGFIDPEQLGDHLAQRARLPARPVVAATAALQRVQSFDTLWSDLMRTRRVRGIRADRGLVPRLREVASVTMGLLVGAVGQAAVLALAMDARGFAEARRRTWAGPAPWRAADWLAVLAAVVINVVAVLAALTL